MKRIAGKASLMAGVALAGFMVAQPLALYAQGTGAILHGHVTNPAGLPQKVGDVKLTTDKNAATKDRVYKFSFPISANGDYKGADLLPGDYLAVVIADGKTIDFQNVTLKGRSGADAGLRHEPRRVPEGHEAGGPGGAGGVQEEERGDQRG